MTPPRRTIVVQKTRSMIARDLVAHLGGSEWEERQFQQLRIETLRALALAAIPGWRTTMEAA